MAKVSGAYPSLSRGVSQQVPEARLDGQHGEQVNMWTDPVAGLARRRGTVQQTSILVNTVGSVHNLTPTQQAELTAYFAAYRTVPYNTGGQELVVHYPTLPKPSWANFSNQFPGGVWVTQKVNGGAQIKPIGKGSGSPLAQLLAKEYKGFSAACQVGRYFLLYPNATPFTHAPETNEWGSEANNIAVVQIKAGIPNRKYGMSIRIGGTVHEFSYQTPSSAYGGALDTSDIAYSDPEYSKKVNDRVNAYNSAATQWITTSAAATRPAYIASQLAAAASAVIPQNVSGTLGSAVLLNWVFGITLSAVEATDSGDDTNVAVTFETVKSIDSLTSVHYTGKVVRIQPGRGTEGFYMRAVGVTSAAGWSQVRWEECPQTSQPAPAFPMVVMTTNQSAGPDKGKVFAAASPAQLASLVTGETIGLPTFGTRLVGDNATSPAPRYVNSQVDYMAMFQDRLVLAVGNVICMSEVGNYFNFWRTATLTVPDRDPVEIYALGSEDDVIRHGVLFDRSLLLFGERQQYVIPGRNPVTPSTSAVMQSGAIEDSVDAPPVGGGSLVFFGKRRENSSELFQIAVGDVADTTNYTGLGLQLLDYIPGKPAQLLHVASPGLLLVRTDAAPSSLFVFRYIDQGNQRVLDSWSRFDYGEKFGQIVGMFLHDDAVYLDVWREAAKVDGIVWPGRSGGFGWRTLERQSLLPQGAELPYLDSMRTASSFISGAGDRDWYNQPYLSAAVAKTAPAAFLRGLDVAPVSTGEFDATFGQLGVTQEQVYVGLPYASYVELTSPRRRSQDGQAITQGRLSVAALDISCTASGGAVCSVTAYGKTTAVTYKLGRLMGQPANVVGTDPVATAVIRHPVQREVREYTCRVAALNWQPLTIPRVTWTGQWFMNHRFV